MSRLLAALLLACSFGALALEDPMRPPMVASSARKAGPVEPEFSLSSTWISRNRRAAVINGKTVGVGDRVGDAEVIEILPTQVRLQQRDGERVVRLLPVSVKTPAKTQEREQQ